ncbi:hypothetical protein II582_01870 [bacterium]|nr:hypothetical protein [bacterium]
MESQVTPQAVQQEMPQVDQQEVSSNVSSNVSVSGSNSEINLDSLVAGTEPVNQTVVLDNNTNSDINN